MVQRGVTQEDFLEEVAWKRAFVEAKRHCLGVLADAGQTAALSGLGPAGADPGRAPATLSSGIPRSGTGTPGICLPGQLQVLGVDRASPCLGFPSPRTGVVGSWG